MPATATPEFKRLQMRAARLLNAIEEARQGRPRELIALLWPAAVLDAYQMDIIESGLNPVIREVYVKGNTGCGKGAAAGILVCLYYIIWPDAKVVITRDSKQRAVEVMFGEVAKWWRNMALCPVKAILQMESIIDPDRPKEHSVVVANPGSDEGFSGVHSPHVMHLYDEATADVLVPRFKLSDTQATIFVALCNPRVTSGPVRNAFPKDDPDRTQTILGPRGYRRCITIGGRDCRNVREKRLEKPIAPAGGIDIGNRHYRHGDTIPPEDYARVKPIIPGQTCYDTYLGLCANPDPEYVRIYAEGKFPREDPEKQLILGRWITAACERHTRWRRCWDRFGSGGPIGDLLARMLPVECFGLDVAASTTGDWSVLAAGGRNGVRALHRTQFADTMRTTGWVISTIRDRYGIDIAAGGIPIAIDCDGGYGLAVANRLQEQGAMVIEIRGSASPEVNQHRYKNKRAECWGELALRMDTDQRAGGDQQDLEAVRPDLPQFMLPDDPQLREDLAAPEKLYGSDGVKFGITPKEPVPGVEGRSRIESLKERLGRSPDDGDAVVYMFRAAQAVGVDLTGWLEMGAF